MLEFQATLCTQSAAALGEGPLWDVQLDELKWVDIDLGQVHTFSPQTGHTRSIQVGQPVGALGFRRSGGLLLAVRDGFAYLDGTHLRLVAAVEIDRPENRMNEGRVDPAGRFWAGTMAFAETAGAGSLYRLDPDLSVHRMLGGLTISNGLDWTADGRTMYFIDSGEGGVDEFDFDLSSGAITNRTRLIDIPPSAGTPDGMTLDNEGHLWVALWGGWAVNRYSQAGHLEATVAVPASQVTSCTFGGSDLAELFITTARTGLSSTDLESQPHAGSIFSCRPGVVGRPAHRFLD